MIDFAQDCLLALLLVISIFSVGLVVSNFFRPTRGLRSLGQGAAFGVIVHALFGLWVANTRQMRPVVLGLLLLTIACSIGYLWKQRTLHQLLRDLSRPARLFLGLWLILIFICIGAVRLPLRWPASLPDGRYIFKEHTLNVKIQTITSLPADNYIPYVVSQYLLRHISFQSERPVIPGWEVSNRTILMSLVSVPFLALIDTPSEYLEPLPRFEYVGTSWPDVMKLYDEIYFRHFLVSGIVLNSLLLLGLGVLFEKFANTALLPIAALLYVTNQYFITQTIFTWPKAFGAFFVVLILDSLARKDNAKWTGLWAALAYHCHPYGLAFAIGAALYYLYEAYRKRLPLRSAIHFAVVFAALVAPWLIWTNLILHIPSKLIYENFAGAPVSAQARTSLVNFVWVRCSTLFDLLTPKFFSFYPFKLSVVVSAASYCLPGAVGLVVIFPAMMRVLALRHRPLLWLWAVVPGLLIVGAFGYRAIVGIHGFQAVIAVLLCLGLQEMHRTLKPRLFWLLVSVQLALNLWLLLARARVGGVHFG